MDSDHEKEELQRPSGAQELDDGDKGCSGLVQSQPPQDQPHPTSDSVRLDRWFQEFVDRELRAATAEDCQDTFPLLYKELVPVAVRPGNGRVEPDGSPRSVVEPLLEKQPTGQGPEAPLSSQPEPCQASGSRAPGTTSTTSKAVATTERAPIASRSAASDTQAEAPKPAAQTNGSSSGRTSSTYVELGPEIRVLAARRRATDLWVTQQAASSAARRPNQARGAQNNPQSRMGSAYRSARLRSVRQRHSMDILRKWRHQQHRQSQSRSMGRCSPGAVDQAVSPQTAPSAGRLRSQLQRQPQSQAAVGTRDNPVVLSNSSSSSSSRGSSVFTVEAIRDIRQNPETGVTEWLIKWRNYPESANSWEPTKNLKCPGEIDKFEQERSRKWRTTTAVRRTIRMSTGAKDIPSTSGTGLTRHDKRSSSPVNHTGKLRERVKKAKEQLRLLKALVDKTFK